MSTPAETPTKPARRSRRAARKSVGPTSSPIHSSQDAEVSADTAIGQQTSQPTRILRRGDPDAITDAAPAVYLDATPPHTPPRPRSMYEGSTNRHQSGNGSAPETSQNKKKTPKIQGRKQSGLASPMPLKDGTPISAPRRESLTPNRTNETPVKAYAGPTFHASPAASSLPMPKFFSKSVPNVDKTSSLRTMLEHEVPTSLSSSEESSSLENIQPFKDHISREESPLDVLFQADMEAKARTGSMPNIARTVNNQMDRTASPYVPQTPVRHHSRHSSVGGMFALEMDGATQEISSDGTAPETSSDGANNHASVSPASSGLTEAEREEQRKAQTIALKKLLYSPRPQIPHNVSICQRPPSSKLRKEISMPTSPKTTNFTELPATPTPSCVHNIPAPTNGHTKQQNGYRTPYSPFPPTKPNQGLNVPFNRDATNSKSIEDDLRRILKMDVLGSDGVTGLRS